METFSRMLPLTTSRFPPGLRDELLANQPSMFEEDLSASYIQRESLSYTHNPTRAAIAITAKYRLVVMNGKAKKIDIPLNDPRWFSAVTIWADKQDRVNFKVNLGVCGTGTQGSSLEIKVKTLSAGRIVHIVEQARGTTMPQPNVMPVANVTAPQELASPPQSQIFQQQPQLAHATLVTYAELPATNYRPFVPPRKPLPSG